MNKIFPLNTAMFEDQHNVRRQELFQVKNARTAAYQNKTKVISADLLDFFNFNLDLDF